jgi:hypothetical protein
MITVFRWIYFYTYLITELKKFAKLYQLTSFSALRISVPGLCSFPSPNVTLDTVVRDRPFNLKGGGVWFFVSFRIFFSDNTRAFCVLSRLTFWFSPIVVFLESCLDWPFVISIDICLHVLSRPTSWVSFLIVYSVVSCVDWQLGYLCWYSSQSYTYFVEIDRFVITIDRLPGGLSRLTFGYFYW